MTQVGRSVPRLEDRRLLTGAGRFVDDLHLPHTLHMRMVRSQVAHGRLVAVDTAAASEIPGVELAVGAQGFNLVPRIPIRLQLTEETLEEYLQPVLAHGTVRYVGEPVAVILAEDPYLAEDAAEAVTVEIEPLDPALDAAGEDATRATTLDFGFGDIEEAFDQAEHTVEIEVAIGRHAAVPLENRGVVAEFDSVSGILTLHGLTKVPHFNRRVLADMLGMSVEHIRFTTTDAGGGFGSRGELYPEDCLAALLSTQLNRPVKWIEDRGEHLVAANHSRQQIHRLRAAVTADGTMLGLEAAIIHDNGAYMRTHGVTVAELTATMLPGPYRLAAYRAGVEVMLTNKTPAGTYRAPGRYEGTFARERLFDAIAAELGLDPVEIRRRNLLASAELPLNRGLATLGTEVIIDAGDPLGLFERTIDTAGFGDWGGGGAGPDSTVRRGRGIGVFMEKSGLGPYETARATLGPDGQVTVAVGGTSLGQGIETVMAQIAADRLGVDASEIVVVHGESDLVPDGVGSWASRSTVVGGVAASRAAEGLATEILAVGAELLGSSPTSAKLDAGRVVDTAGGRSVGFSEVAAEALRQDRKLAVGEVFHVDHMTYPYGIHLAEVEVDTGTGGITVTRYFVGYEIGRAVNPRLVEGQLLGGVAQGLGGALLEEFRYDENGQPLSTTFMDYLLPTALEVPDGIGLLVSEEWPAGNELGVRGAGEGGITGVGAAVANAVADALGDPTAIVRLPVEPQRVLGAIGGEPDRSPPPGPIGDTARDSGP